ncbi:MAG: hypothetical protein MUF71_13925 [Candidatus Kapabacteria bacterium]|jgi:hypothetical protein|nr:hypothetical protein [Candidatus Kapabacteria bacterium]
MNTKEESTQHKEDSSAVQVNESNILNKAAGLVAKTFEHLQRHEEEFDDTKKRILHEIHSKGKRTNGII